MRPEPGGPRSFQKHFSLGSNRTHLGALLEAGALCTHFWCQRSLFSQSPLLEYEMVWYQQLSGEKQSGVNKQYSCGGIP